MISRRKLILFIVDCFCIGLAVRFVADALYGVSGAELLHLSVAYPLAFYLVGLYETEEIRPNAEQFVQVVVALILVHLGISAVSYTFPEWHTPRKLLLATALVAPIVFPLPRLFLNLIIRLPQTKTRVAVLGDSAGGAALAALLRAAPEYELVGVYSDAPIGNEPENGRRSQNGHALGDKGPTLQYVDDFLGDLSVSRPDVVAVASRYPSTQLVKTLVACRRRGIRVTELVEQYETLTRRVPVEHISPSWLAVWSGIHVQPHGLESKLKRLVDSLGALILLAILSPLLLLAALAIRLETGGEVIYRQRRVGRAGKPFELFKLRTMVFNAEEESGAVWAQEGDVRITGVGRFLRRTRLDEVPQLLNVLRGEMSLVGPRPERPEFVQDLEKKVPYYGLRHIVKPGLTGWAQVNYPYGASVADALRKLEYDLYYIRHWGTLFDIRILLKTVHIVLFGKGSR